MEVDFMSNFEKLYNSMLNKTFKYASPMKKIITTPDCKVHIFINTEALDILDKNNYNQISTFFREYIEDINEGAIWADQDFKSSNHLYNPYTQKGLYGRKNAMEVAKKYYEKATRLYKASPNKALFYLGATLHIIQDMCVPHHASVKLLNKHRRLEHYIRRNYIRLHCKDSKLEPHILNHISQYINYNGKESLNIYEDSLKLHKEGISLRITTNILPLAMTTTAGCLIKYYKDVVGNIN